MCRNSDAGTITVLLIPVVLLSGIAITVLLVNCTLPLADRFTGLPGHTEETLEEADVDGTTL
jgi:hypothetical protein